MNKEMFISSSPHETKVAVCEDGQLVEVYFERDTDEGLVGGIYKGRVSRVLPGMQSAFVNIGLERDAFLYVSDFSLQDQEDFEGLLEDSQTRGGTIEVEAKPDAGASAANGEAPPEQAAEATLSAPSSQDSAPEPGGLAGEESASEVATETSGPAENAAGEGTTPSSKGSNGEGSRHHSRRGRRRRRHGRGGSDQRRFNPRPESRPPLPESQPPSPGQSFELLPGESLAKYGHAEPGEAGKTEVAAPVAEDDSALQAESRETERFEAAAGPSESLQAEETVPVAAESSSESVEHELGDHSNSVPSAESGQSSNTETAEELSAAPVPAPEDLGPDEGLASNLFEARPATLDERHVEGESSEEAPDAGSAEVAEAATAEPPETEGGPEEQAAQASEASEAPAESSERSATLREPHSRPHFAPRRGRRGRRRAGRHSRRQNNRETARTPVHPGQGLQISELLKEGQEIIVQIAKEPLGTKGARITSHVALPGRYIVYMPTIAHIGVSRKIASEQERLRLRNIILENKGSLTGGFIVRTAGEGRSEDEIKADLQFLTSLWNEIRTKAERVKAPSLLYRDLDLAQRLLRDLVTPDFKNIWLDNEADYEQVVEFVSRLQPSLVGHVKLHTRENSLFEVHGIQGEIEKALRPKVWLKSGGYIVINQTEALIAIDVNTGKYVGKTNRLEDTIVKTNIDAVNEIVRQIRLRDLGGIIVIDFIDMDERRNRNKVVQALEEAMRRDRAPTKVLSFNDFGLVAVTRKRVKQSLERTLCDPCTYCNGSGWIKSVSSVCLEILSEARKMCRAIDGKSITLRVNPDVAHALKSNDGTMISEIETITHKDVIIKSDPTIHQERFEIF